MIPALKRAGYTVTGLDRNEPAREDRLDRFIHGDVRAPQVLSEALGGVDTVIHLAAARGDWGIDEDEYYEENVGTTEALIEAGKRARIQRWIFYSSVSAIGPRERPGDEGTSLSPRGPYGGSKAQAEALFRGLASERPECEILILRPSVVFGPGHPPDTNVFRLIEAIHENRFLMVGDGSTPKSTSYIENLLAAHQFLMERMEPGLAVYIYVDHPVLTTGEIVSVVCSALGRKPPRWSLPLGPTRRLAVVFDWLASLLNVDLPITKARIEKFCRGTNYDASAIRELGFSQPVHNREALRRTVAWHLEHKNLQGRARQGSVSRAAGSATATRSMGDG